MWLGLQLPLLPGQSALGVNLDVTFDGGLLVPCLGVGVWVCDCGCLLKPADGGLLCFHFEFLLLERFFFFWFHFLEKSCPQSIAYRNRGSSIPQSIANIIANISPAIFLLHLRSADLSDVHATLIRRERFELK